MRLTVTFMNILALIATATLGVSVSSRPLRADENGLSFDIEAQSYIRDRVKNQNSGAFNWLMPFCTDLTPYWDRNQPNVTPATSAQYVCNHFQEKWIPEGWSYDSVLERPRSPKDTTWRVYRKVPNTVFPIKTIPNGNPIFFYMWEHPKNGVKLSMVHSSLLKSVVVLIAQKDTGFQIESPSATDIAKIASEYFCLPPKGMLAPNTWALDVVIDNRDGRFYSGRVRGKFDGEWGSGGGKGNGGAWGNREQSGRFYFDGKNLAFVVTPISQGAAKTEPVPPVDVDWDTVEKKEKEDAKKAKPNEPIN